MTKRPFRVSTKKIVIALTLLLITGLAASWYFFAKESKYFGTTALKAVPVDSPFFVRIQNIAEYSAQVRKNPFWSELSVFQGVNDACHQFALLDSLLQLNPEVKQMFGEKSLIVVPGKGASLLLAELSSLAEKRALSSFIHHYFKPWSPKPLKIESGEAEITQFTTAEGKPWFIAFYQGLFFGSGSKDLIVKAVEQMMRPSVIDDPNFRKVNKTSALNIDANIFLNHQYLSGYLAPFFNDSVGSFIKETSFAEWTEIDLIQRNNTVLLNGFSFSDETFKHYLDLFLYQKSGAFTLSEAIPSSSSFYMALNIESADTFFNDYNAYCKATGTDAQWKSDVEETIRQTGIDPVKFVTDHLDREVAVVYTLADSVQNNENRLMVMKLNDAQGAKDILLNAAKFAATKSGTKEFTKNFKIDHESSFEVISWPVENFGAKVFGRLFGATPTQWFAFYHDYLVMGGSYNSVERYLRSLILGETLVNDAEYKEFSAGMAQWSSFSMWFQPAFAWPFFQHLFEGDMAAQIDQQKASLGKISSFGWQFGAENKMIYNTVKLSYSDQVRKKSNAFWRSFIGSRIVGTPQWVANPFERKERALMLQTNLNELILINHVGRIIWKYKTPSALLGEVKQVEMLKDGQMQFVFNTAEKLFVVDRNGNNLADFPLQLPSVATNGVSVFDYDGRRDYRFCVACEDDKIYLYDKKGRSVEGWEPQRTEYRILQPVRHLRSATKDYIVFFDKAKLTVLDRKGKERVAFPAHAPLSANDMVIEKVGKGGLRLIKTDREGTILFFTFDGKIQKLSVGKFSSDHYFSAADLTGDGKLDFVFFDKGELSLFDYSGSLLFTKDLTETDEYAVVACPDARRIAVTNLVKGEIYLFDSTGALAKGFPLSGSSAVACGWFQNQNATITLLAGSPDGYLNNYQLK